MLDAIKLLGIWMKRGDIASEFLAEIDAAGDARMEPSFFVFELIQTITVFTEPIDRHDAF